MYTSKVIKTLEITTLNELSYVVSLFEAVTKSNVVYVVDKEGAPMQLELVQNTLTDGSKTFDVKIV